MSTIDPGVTGRRRAGKGGVNYVPPAQAPPAAHGPAAFTIPEFCEAHRISVAYYYELKKAGLAPRTMKGLGNRQIITVEEAARWRVERTEEPTTESAA